MLWQCTHTSRTTIHTFIRIEKHEERRYTKRWCKNEGRKGISFKRRFLPYLSLASDLTPSHPTSTRLPTNATPDARKREGIRRRSSTMYRSCVKLKWHINFSLSNIYSFCHLSFFHPLTTQKWTQSNKAQKYKRLSGEDTAGRSTFFMTIQNKRTRPF